jgi:hypothetical protein
MFRYQIQDFLAQDTTDQDTFSVLQLRIFQSHVIQRLFVCVNTWDSKSDKISIKYNVSKLLKYSKIKSLYLSLSLSIYIYIYIYIYRERERSES